MRTKLQTRYHFHKTFDIDLTVSGKNWDEANRMAQEVIKNDPEAFFVHPFSQETTWQGHSTLIEEVKEQMTEQGFESPPSCVVTCAGGGGLAIGLVDGMEQAGWNQTPLVIVETEGASNFHQSIKTGTRVVLDGINTIATSMGARAIEPRLLELAKMRPIISKVVTDTEALKACYKFSKDHRLMVEPACGAVLNAAYRYSDLDLDLESDPESPMVVVVCGGCMASFEVFDCWRQQLGIPTDEVYQL